MADEFNTGTNWWDSSAGNRFDSTGPSSASSGHNSLGCSFAWPIEMADIKVSSSLESVSVSDSSSVFHDTQKLQHGHDSAGDSLIMNLGLSSQAMDWNQALLGLMNTMLIIAHCWDFSLTVVARRMKTVFPSMLHENLNSSTDYQQETGMGSSQIRWSERVITGVSVDSTMNEFKQIGHGFSLDQPQFSPHGSSSDSPVICQGLQPSFQMDSSVTYGNPSTMFLGLLGSENQPQKSSFESRTMSYPYRAANYGVGGNESSPSSSSKVPQFLRNSPPHSQLHFSNNAPFWNASASAVNDVRPSFFPSPQPQFPTPKFEQKLKQNMSKVLESSAVGNKSSGSEAAAKRPRNETPSPLPPIKARKEKIGDRITALQQLVSPFGKTDTASVLSEAIEYIKVLHEQVTVLSTPYMKSILPIHHQQGTDKSKDPEEQKQDLRSRGLCLVPVSSTFPVAHETTVDFWTPTFGGTFR